MKRERLITLLHALGALALFTVIFLNREGSIGGRNDVPAPTTAERRGSGYHAAIAWLQGEGVRALAFRERLETLPEREDLARTGNLLIVTLPARTAFRTTELRPLERWIRDGNTLLVLAALSDNPEWSERFGGFAWGEASLLTGLEFESSAARGAPGGAEQPAAPKRFAEPERTLIVPNRPHAYFEGVERVVALSDYPREAWSVKVPYEGFVLTLAHEERNGVGALWTRALGAGRIIVSGHGSLFTNRAIALEDNARLLANIVAANVGENGAVLFDDLHQGHGAAYDPEQFYKDPRLYLTIAILVALWLVWVLGSTRLRLPATASLPPRELDLIRAAGGFLSRTLPTHAGARQLLENFFRRITRQSGKRVSSGDMPPWPLLERHARIAHQDVEQLRRWHADAVAGRRVPMRDLHNLLLRLERQMAT